jgi:hypothetical protein
LSYSTSPESQNMTFLKDIFIFDSLHLSTVSVKK